MATYQFNPEVEQWKEIYGFPGYEVSDHGRIRSFWQWAKPKLLKSPRLLKLALGGKKGQKTKYQYISIGRRQKRNKFLIHRIVLLTFVGPCPDGFEACHNDGNSLNNRLDNLRWDSHKSNKNDDLCNGKSKLSIPLIYCMRAFYKCGFSQSKIANIIKPGINPAHVGFVIRRRSWKHI